MNGPRALWADMTSGTAGHLGPGATSQVAAVRRRSKSPSSSPSSTRPSRLEGSSGAGSLTAETGSGPSTGCAAFALRVYVGGGTGTGAQPDGSTPAEDPVRSATSPSADSDGGRAGPATDPFASALARRTSRWDTAT